MIDHRPALLLLCLMLAACGPDKSGSSASGTNAAAGRGSNNGRPQTVTVGRTRTESVPVILQAQGFVTAQDEVDIRPEKTGMVSAIHVKEGDEVQKGQLLFSLDSRDDEANVKKAEAALLSSKTQYSADQRTLERNKELSAKGFISTTALDQLQSKVDTGLSAIALADSVLASAKVQLSYDRITAPFSGRVGTINVRPGSMMTTNSATSMVKITRINPITVNFSLPESNLTTLRAAMSGGSVKVQAGIPDSQVAQGKVVFIENNVDRTSGTIAVKAEIDNQQRLLWPGQYTPVRIFAGEIKNAVTLPAQAVQSGPEGRFVYVIKEDKTVKPQPVQLVQVYQERAIITGIDSNVKVVLEGGQNLRPGGRVTEASATASAGRGKRDSSKPASAAEGSAPAQTSAKGA